MINEPTSGFSPSEANSTQISNFMSSMLPRLGKLKDNTKNKPQ